MSTIRILEEYDARVRELVLGGTRGNLITAALVEDLRAALHEAAADPKRSLIIISGDGPHFSYGADVAEHLPDHIRHVLPAFHSFIGELLACDVPTLARVSGFCLGGGFEIALACSMLWCDRTAKIGLPEISLGVFPPVASILLPERVAPNIASELILTGRTLTGTEAHRLGIANECVPRNLFTTRLHDFVVTYLLPKSASSLRLANAAARARIRRRYAENIAAVEAFYLSRLMATHDAAEGARAFLEKRVPDWEDA